MPGKIRIAYDEAKTTAAASVLLELAGGRMPYIKLMKLLYLADRLSWDQIGRPISGDSYYAMDKGMVLSTTLNHIRGLATEGAWERTVRTTGNYAELAGDIDDAELSDAEIEILESVFKAYGHLEPWKLVDLLHEMLPEWKHPQGSSKPVPPEEILRHLGKSPETVAEIADLSQTQYEIGRVISGGR